MKLCVTDSGFGEWFCVPWAALFSAPMVAVKSGKKELSLRTLPFPFRLSKQFRIYPKRRQDFLPPYTPATTVTVKVIPPKGWRVSEEPRLSLTSPFGHITRTVRCSADGSALITFEKRIAFSPVPVAKWTAFREFIKTFSDYESLGLTLSRP